MTTSALEPHAAFDPIADLMPRRRPWWLVAVLAAALVAAGVVSYRKLHHPAAPAPYVTAALAAGDVVETIEATGTLQPVLQVQVGSQVSGRIQALHADFNSPVHRGDLLAEIDPTTFRAALAQQQASVRSAEAQLQRARTALTLQQQNLDRAADLRRRALNAQADLDAARAARDDARAQVAVASAQLGQATASRSSAETNLELTRIYAPMDGVVITRSVDVGQTVAASLSAPVLFVIANDLTRMQVVANVDESSVGRLAEAQHAQARVDAFPGVPFEGTVREIRQAPTTTQGVVTYPAIIDVANTNGRLRPGMTATVTVVTNRHEGVLRVPNAALRFRPADAASVARPATRPAAGAGINGRIYVLRNGTAAMVPVHVGLTDGAYTEVSGEGLAAGVAVITDQPTAAATAARPAAGAGASNPFGGGGPGGGAGAGGARGARRGL